MSWQQRQQLLEVLERGAAVAGEVEGALKAAVAFQWLALLPIEAAPQVPLLLPMVLATHLHRRSLALAVAIPLLLLVAVLHWAAVHPVARVSS